MTLLFVKSANRPFSLRVRGVCVEREGTLTYRPKGVMIVILLVSTVMAHSRTTVYFVVGAST